MPIFEYQCKQCQKRFEELVSRSSEKDVKCPQCHSKSLSKLPSVTGGIFSKSGPACPASASCAEAGPSCCAGGCCARGD